VEYVCTHMVIVVVFSQLISTLISKILSSWHSHPSRVPKS
jgi:hypothetical protein